MQYKQAAQHVHSMKWLRLPKRESSYVDTPQGIFTDALIWFRTREAWIQEYAGAVLEHRALGRLLSDAAVWLRSPQTLALWMLPALLVSISALHAALATVLFFAAWQALGPSLVSRGVLPALRILELVVLQALVYVGTLSWLASEDRIAAMAVGLAGFVLLRWGVLRMAFRPLTKMAWRALYRMPVADHVLRAIIVRNALRHRVTLADFAAIEEDIVRHLGKQ